MSAARPTETGLPAPWLSLALAAVIWAALWPLQTFEMRVYLLPWMAHIGAHGPVGVFGHPFSNYTPTYLYVVALASLLATLISDHGVVKFVSLLGTLWLAWSIHHLLRVSGAPAPARAGALTLLLPSAIVNAALLGQCDAFWAAACVMAVASAIDRRPAAMLLWCGLAFAFKAQAIFLAPFAIAMLIAWRSRWTLWAIPPAVYLTAMVPAWAAGWPAADLLSVYLRQAGTFDQLSMNAPNLWQLVQAAPGLDAPIWRSWLWQWPRLARSRSSSPLSACCGRRPRSLRIPCSPSLCCPASSCPACCRECTTASSSSRMCSP